MHACTHPGGTPILAVWTLEAMTQRRAKTYDRPQRSPQWAQQACAHPGCQRVGEYRAPRSRRALKDYVWFCLDHVRMYNAAWDFYRGMSADEIESMRRQDTVGWRPTWPFGSKRDRSAEEAERVRAAFAKFFGHEEEREQPRAEARRAAHGVAAEALAILSLPPDATPAEVKSRYKELVKRHHPDANGGDKDAEERLKSINQAYSTLKGLASA